MNFAAIYLAFGGLVTFGFGMAYLVRSERMARMVGIQLPSASARADYRAIYGGAQVALGIFFALAAFQGWLVPGLVGLGLFALGFGVVRLASLAIDRAGRNPQWIVGVLETLAGVLAIGLGMAAG